MTRWPVRVFDRLLRMWPAYVIYALYLVALFAAAATVPIARRGKRRVLWDGWGTVAFALTVAATSSVTRLVPPSIWPVWRFAVAYILILAAPTGVAALVADHLARRRPMPRAIPHAAFVACAVAATVAASAVVSRPFVPDFAIVSSEQ
jgi:hypothetical protein